MLIGLVCIVVCIIVLLWCVLASAQREDDFQEWLISKERSNQNNWWFPFI